MRNLILLIAVLAAPLTRGVEPDKLLHVGYAYGATLTGTLLLRKAEVPHPELVAGITVFAIGVLKEILHDVEPDPMDVLANTIGIAGSIGVCYTFNL